MLVAISLSQKLPGLRQNILNQLDLGRMSTSRNFIGMQSPNELIEVLSIFSYFIIIDELKRHFGYFSD